MEKVTTGANRLSSGLARAQERSGELTTSAHLLESAMSSGEDRLAEVDASIHAAEARLAGALEALRGMTTGRSDPRYAAALEATEGAHASLAGSEPGSDEGETASPAGAAVGVARARGQFSLGLYLAGRLGKSGRAAADGLAKLARGSARLDRALSTLAGGSRQVDQGLARLAAGGQRLPPGLNRLSEGATRLGSGLGLVETGAGALAGGLGDGAQRSRLLSGGLSKIGAGVARQRGAADDAPALRDRSPRLFRSGYLYLAALDGSSPQQRQRAALLVNINRGGRAARMIVIPRRSSEDAGAAETRQRLEGYAGHLARQTGTNVLVGGASASQLDANSAFRGRSAFARLALALITILILVPVMRSLTIPLIAALLNVLTVAATFGLMALAFNDSLLGGPGYVDAAVVPATIVVIFGLAIDYEVFIFARIREEYERSGSTDEAIARGLGRTAPVVTGAALIMIVVFLSFATSSFSTDRDFGTAQAIAVAIDAFIIRLIVVPALMRSMGPWAWWLPRWLDRLLPRGRKTAQARSDPRAASVQPATLPVAPLDD
jgi:RND superfamily putative drug exporter